MALNGTTIPAIVAQHVAAHGGETIFRKKDRGIWKAVTWTELAGHVEQIAAGLQAAGFRPRQVAGMLTQTRPDAAYADLAILASGGACLAIHPDEEPDQLGHILRTTNCSLLFVENEEQLDKALTVRAACPSLRQIVIFDMKGLRDFDDPACSSLAAFRASGTTIAAAGRPDPFSPAIRLDPSALAGSVDRSLPPIGADQPAILLFPFGERGGRPRTLTHGDVMHLLASTSPTLGLRPGDERLAVLPMSTLMEHVLGLHLALWTRTISNYLESPETAVENLQEVQPTVFGADAEAWSRLHERTTSSAKAATRLQGALYRWAVVAGQNGGLLAGLAHLLVLTAVRRELGLNRLRLAYVCGTPVPADVLAWANALGITIQRVDGAAPRGAVVDARSRALMEEAYSGT